MTTLVIQPYRFREMRRLRYQQQDSALTLEEGLNEYYLENEGIVTKPEYLEGTSASLFSSHDVCHVDIMRNQFVGEPRNAGRRVMPRNSLELWSGSLAG